MPRAGRGQDHEGEVTFPSKTVCLSFKIASGKATSSRKPSRLARKELLLSPQEAQCGQETPRQRASNAVRKKKRKKLDSRGR